MGNRIQLLTPVGRLVQGSLYDAQTTNAEGKPLTVRTGANAGQQRKEYYFAIALRKGQEPHWSQTEWGKIIWDVGHKGFPNGQADSPTFAWKIIDGDSQVPNRVGRKPCDREGYPGHWVLNFTSGFAPSVYNADGSKQIVEEDAVNLGDYIQVYGNVGDNGSTQQPGVFLNHSMVALAGYGERIVLGADPKAVGFGQSPLPPGASPTPLAQGFNPAPTALEVQECAAIQPPPYTQILTPPTTVKTHVMLPAAGGATYEQLIGAGWTDELLIQHGFMQA